MTDDIEMRKRLQQVAAYRDLCRRVRRSGRENIVFALIMLFLAYTISRGPVLPVVVTLYLILAVGELLVGVFKVMRPSAEGVFLDGIVLLIFAVYNLGFMFWRFQNGIPPDLVIIFLGLFMLMGAVGRFKDYRLLRQLFARRPGAEHIAWFDELIAEIRLADPESDDQAIDLPTQPHWKAKLLGSLAFFVSRRGNHVLVAGPEDFEILREKTDHGTGRRQAILRLFAAPSPEFPIADATWANYQKWRATYPLPTPQTAAGECE